MQKKGGPAWDRTVFGKQCLDTGLFLRTEPPPRHGVFFCFPFVSGSGFSPAVVERSILTGAKVQYEREQAEDDPVLNRRIANQAFSARLREIAEEVYDSKETEEERLDLLTDRMLEEVQAQTCLPDGVIKTLKPLYKRIIKNSGQTGTGDESKEGQE